MNWRVPGCKDGLETVRITAMKSFSELTPYIRRMVTSLTGRRMIAANQSAGVREHDHYLEEALALNRAGRIEERSRCCAAGWRSIPAT
jgi:hypothetical protein